MEIVLGFFGTKKMTELTDRGILRYGGFVHEVKDDILAIYPEYEGREFMIPVLTTVMMAMERATKIHFVCNELDLAYKPEVGLFGEDIAYTMKEYYAIMSTTSWRNKTKFYGRVKNKNAQIFISEMYVMQIADFKNKLKIS